MKKANTKDTTSRVDNQNSLFSKINNDLALIMGDEAPGAKGRSARAFSASERQKRKEELEKWKKDK